MRVVACAIVCGWLAGPAGAMTLYRCVAADGMVSYQDAPCAGGSMESRRIPVRAEPEPEARPKAANSAKRTKKSTIRSKPSRSASRAQTRLTCSKAREEREVALERLGLRRTFEHLRALDDRVYEACKGL